ncbi:hypothetical protein [Geopseudomonas aromaticivorans]
MSKSIETRLAEVAAKLQDHGVHSVTVEYAGAGDSANGYEVAFLDRNGESLEPYAEIEDLVTELADEAIFAAGQDGWEDNEGGSGTFTFSVEGTARLEHTDNRIESDQDLLAACRT